MFHPVSSWQHFLKRPLAVVNLVHDISISLCLCEEKKSTGIWMGDLPLLLALC